MGSNALIDLAKSINQEPGMTWKTWTESEKDKLGGGIYLFEDEATAQAYLEMHTARLKQMGVEEVRGQILDINTPLSNIDQGPIGE
ncbi:monooxygenase [Vibrio diabolicus]|uniref:monooxygenase n=1 Tax=Vibrio diabolicus TaxID=50719 RepID=UPI00232C6B94|nr:monooxygenase [Vibrio diabolicus]